jgi:hypothetical protein
VNTLITTTEAATADLAALLADSVPIRFYWQAGPDGMAPMVDWCWLGAERFTDPFFEQTIERCLRLPFNQLFRHQTPVSDLLTLQRKQPGLAPSGFIFHMSRCGSTLVAQMLAALPQHIVISEAGPIDAVLRARERCPALDEALWVSWLRAMVSALGRPRGGEKHFFIKFDSWHSLFLPLIRRAFPTVPWVFLYRDPVEVLVSHRRQRGAQTVPGMLHPSLFGLNASALSHVSPDEYTALVLARICAAALHAYDQRGCLINYRHLPGAVEWLAQHFGLAYEPGEWEQMRRITAFDAKTPTLPFRGDGDAKQRAADESLRRLVDQQLMPLYERLEAVRHDSEGMTFD